MRVFIVEDEAVIAMELEERLEALGHEVCGHAARADRALTEVPAARPDVVLMDVNLGRGMSGFEVAELLRARLDAPIVFLTAYTSAELERRAAGGEALHYLVKPFRAEGLRAIIEAAVAHHASSSPRRG